MRPDSTPPTPSSPTIVPAPPPAPASSAIASMELGPPAPPPAPRTRRSLLAAALGGLAATVAGALGRPSTAAAAAGSALIIGSETNNAGTSNTSLTTSSAVVAFRLLQNGPGTALMGYATPSTGNTRGVYGRTDSPNGFGVQARNAGSAGAGAAVQAIGDSNIGVEATTSSNAMYALKASNLSGSGPFSGAIYADGGQNHGIYARTSHSSGYAVIGTNFGATGAGVVGSAQAGDGVIGSSSNGRGAWGHSVTNDGVRGSTQGEFASGVFGSSSGSSGHGVVGSISVNSGTAAGVYGASAGSGSYAGYFEGHVGVTGSLSKGGGSFRIDHPLDPANKVLQHSFVESPDMLNIYNGVATADAKGEATVELPDWFMALNRDFRYGLTPIGAFAPLFVKSKVAAGRFTIAGAAPGQEVSWQLTGIRRDAWANANRIEVEVEKPAAQRGQFLHPAAHGKPASQGVDHVMQQRLAAARKQEQVPTPPA
jgi:hypothetical protein